MASGAVGASSLGSDVQPERARKATKQANRVRNGMGPEDDRRVPRPHVELRPRVQGLIVQDLDTA
jgi:hypothetical protein